MFIKFYYSIYERIVKAKDLIKEKLTQDLSEISFDEKKEMGIIEGKKVKESIFTTFATERFEYLLKGIYANFTNVGVGALS